MPLFQVKSIEELESDFTLKDGTSVHIRAIQPEDDHALVEIFKRSSPETVYQRFFTALPNLGLALARHLSHVDYVHRLALIAEMDSGPVGVARYEPTSDPDVVELGLGIVDDWQNRGLGRILLREILSAAEGNAFHRFHAEVLAENRRMLHLLATECQIQDQKIEAGVTSVTLTSRRTDIS